MTTDAPTQPTASFFEPGRTYRYHHHACRCDTLTTHPGTGERLALGWFGCSDGSWKESSAPEAEWAEGAWIAQDQPAPTDRSAREEQQTRVETTTRPTGYHHAAANRDALVDEYGRATTAPLGDLGEFRQKLADTVVEAVRARDEQFIAWLLKKARESRNSRESTEEYLVRLADRVDRGAIR